MSQTAVWFLTDFGLADEWAAVCKAMIWQRAPLAKIFDITHLIPPFDIKTGALILRNAALSIGQSVYLAVVDPSVGSRRRPLALGTNNGSVLIGPDNGLLLPAAEVLGGIKKAVRLTNQQYWRQSVCPTFHGRDIFAPVAAAVVKGIDLENLGETVGVGSLAPAPWSSATREDNLFQAEIIHVDAFGTFRFNISAADIKKAGLNTRETIILTAGKLKIAALLGTTFADAKLKEPLFLIDSAELLCLAVNQGSAAQRFNLRVGQSIQLKWD